MKRVVARLWDFPSAAILVIAQMVVCERLIATGWTPNLGVTGLFCILGILLGLALGISRFSRPVVFVLALGYSVALFPLLAGGSLYHDMAWLERLANLGGRLASSFSLFISGRPVKDTILFLTFLTVTLWVITLSAGHALTRAGNFLGAILPAGVAIFLIQVYDPFEAERSVFLAVFLFLCLLLLGRVTFVRRRLFWKEQRVWFSSESGTDLNITILVAAGALILLAWLTPATNQPLTAARLLWENATRPLQETRKDLGNAIAGLEGNKNLQTSDFYGANLALGQQAAGSSNLLFTVRLPVVQNVARYYWRVRTYNQYLNGEWHTASALERSFSPSRALKAADTRGWETSEFVFSFPGANISILIMPSHPVWVSRPAILMFLPAQEDEVEPILFNVDPPVRAGEEYRVHALAFNPTVKQLREAGTNYPAWVTADYLQLPDDLPPSISALAHQITAGVATPYDQANAITQYLRENITYSKTVPPPPTGRDTLAWFLFDHRAGFCNYYATAEVVMLRAVGIPARMAVGFAEGEFQIPDKRIVRQQDAHAWPEVYFPGIGWIEFEPTVSQAPLSRPSGEVPAGTGPIDSTPQPGNAGRLPAGEENQPGAGQAASASQARFNSLLRLSVLLGVFVLLIVGFWLAVIFGRADKALQLGRSLLRKPLPVLVETTLERLSLPSPQWLKRWAFLAGLTPLERTFGVAYRSLRWLGVRITPAQTPAEAAAALSERLPEATAEIQTLLKEYQHEQYSQRPGDLYTARHAAEAIRRKSFWLAVNLRLASWRRLFRKKR